MGMTKLQIDYSLQRLDDAFDSIMGARPEDDNRARYRENAELFRSGKIKLTNLTVTRALRAFDANVVVNQRWHDSISECLLNEIKLVIKTGRPKVSQMEKDQEVWNKRSKKLRIKFDLAKDELILGDAERALKLIEAFRKTKV